MLLGHSYGGMVATGVAQRRPERLCRLVYLDALVPEPGASAFELVPVRAAGEPGWSLREVDASHSPHVTCPELLAAALADLA